MKKLVPVLLTTLLLAIAYPSLAKAASYTIEVITLGRVSAPAINNNAEVVWRFWGDDTSPESILSSSGRVVASAGGTVPETPLQYGEHIEALGPRSSALAFNSSGVVGVQGCLA